MITPDTEISDKGDPVPFIARWNTLVSALITEPSVKLVARAAVDHGITDGQGIWPGNQRLARQTSLSDESVRRAWAVLRGTGMAHRDIAAHWTGHRRLADEYALDIPAGWRQLPIYGPAFSRFHCQHCGKAFNPQPGTHVRPDGSVGWYLRYMVFCADPGRPKRTPAEKRNRTPLRNPPRSCFQQWGGQDKWNKLGAGAWELFRQARSDDWP
jgi:hypothetical protein